MENKNKETVGLKTIIVRYLHRWKLFLTVFVLSFIPAILYLTIMPRTYEITASVQLQAEKESSMASFGLGEAAGLMKSFGVGSGGGSVKIDDEMAILTSNRMLRLMILD
ncbi:MAG TPA: tyrosine protein kinase, partial [Porphyromonadaceae bacterium]|nr:tyrosine protein kinase [Porphyromonadaceae bacterium]